MLSYARAHGGLLPYSEEHDGQSGWVKHLNAWLPNQERLSPRWLKCPLDTSASVTSYCMNEKIVGIPITNLPGDTELLAEHGLRGHRLVFHLDGRVTRRK